MSDQAQGLRDLMAREEVRKTLLGDDMPMVAGKMSKSGDYENAEYVRLDDAVARILAAGYAKREWLAVTERLPDVGTYVLVVRPDSPTTVRKIHLIMWSDGDSELFSHWQPSPDFPPPPTTPAQTAKEGI